VFGAYGRWARTLIGAVAITTLTAGCQASVSTEQSPTPIPVSPPPPAAVVSGAPAILPHEPTVAVIPTATAVTEAPPASPQAESPLADSSPSPLQRLRVVNTGGSGANLRAEPSSQAERIKTLLDGALLDLLDPGREVGGTSWRQVRDEAGATGWVSAEFLAPLTAVQIRVSPIAGGPAEAPGSTFATPVTRAVPVDRQNCPQSHPVKAVGSGGFFYYTADNPRYASIAPDVCFTSGQVAESLGFRAP